MISLNNDIYNLTFNTTSPGQDRIHTFHMFTSDALLHVRKLSHISYILIYTQQVKFCTLKVSGQLCLNQEWLHLMYKSLFKVFILQQLVEF